jgi:hypothetical protein
MNGYLLQEFGMKHILRGCLFFCLVFSVAGNAADKQGRYSIHGAGLLECKVFVDERKKQSPAYMMMGGWMDGYITAVNKLEKSTFDITSFTTTELLSVLIAQHCATHPDDLLAPVLDAILIKLHADRVKTASPLAVVRVGEFQTQLYTKTLLDIQQRLVRKGFLEKEFKKEPMGMWNESVQAALRKYQKSANLEPTGFPDQKTLWHLFRSKS